MLIEPTTNSFVPLLEVTTELRSSDDFNNESLCADQMIGDLLEGISGRIIWGIIQIVLMILGNVGNLLTIIVLNHRLMRKGGVNNLLQGLAISDVIAPTIACIPHLLYYYGPRTNGEWMKIINIYVIPLATGATFSSNWIVVTITTFRLIIVVKPLYSQIYCSSENERRALLVITFFSIVSIVPYYCFQSKPEAQNIIKLLSALFALLIPWLICIVLWVLLIRIVNREISMKKSQQFILNSEVVAQRLKSKSRITRMVLIICFCNIICQLPVLILTIVGLINVNPCGPITTQIFVALLFVSNLLLIVNHSVNFCIYSLTNNKFRITLRLMCFSCCACHRRLKSRLTTSNADDPRCTPGQQRFDASTYFRTRDSPHLMLYRQNRESSRLCSIPSKSVAV